jgi:murein DD-endopeptidase MepM/ murein hydrolase activator NlpD
MRRRVFRAAFVGTALVAAVAWTAGATLAARRLPVAEPIVVSAAYVERADTVHRNETLSHLFARHNIAGSQLVDVLAAAEGLNPRRIQPGQVFRFRYVPDETTPNKVTVRLGDEQVLTVSRDTTNVWTGRSEEIAWTVHVERVQGSVESSLWLAINQLVPDSVLNNASREYLVSDLADGVFGFVIDFNRESRPGDRFNVVYERLTSALGDVRFGRILAAKVETNRRERSAYVMTDEQGRNAYYDEQRQSLKRAFKLSPVQITRITSRFSRSRMHPVLRIRRPHPGVDYGAATGSRIMATGDGTVTRAQWWGGYGNMISIRHPRRFETRYAHMSRFAPGIGVGSRVVQGQLIGFSGSTGLANGPHVHYELIRDGQQVDPLRLQQDSGDPLPASRRAEFEAVKAQFDLLLAGRSANVAAADRDP